MAAVHGICQAQDRIDLCNADIFLFIKAVLRLAVFRKIIPEIADSRGHDHTLFMGDTDKLGGHNDLVGIFTNFFQIDVTATVVKDHRQLQEQPVMLCHILLAFHGIKDLQGRIFDVVAMIFAAAIAIRNAAGCVDDIIQKAVGRRDLFFALGEVGGHSLTESDAGKPHLLSTGLFENIVIDHGSGQKQGSLIYRGI